MARPRLLEPFCGPGGAAVGYYRAGWEPVGVDLYPQPRYPFEFIQGDALEALGSLLRGEQLGGYRLDDFAAIHASPPCQAYTQAQRLQGNEHPELVEPTRALLEATGLPYVIENVPGAPLRDPVTLCGAMFPPLRTYRHRLFETNWPLPQPPEPPHIARQAKMGRRPAEGEWIQVVGNYADADAGRLAMGTPWMTRDETSEAIPPAYTEWVGRFLYREAVTP